ncbi:hypothetical protein TNCV_568751 [Trichonephila clavipes]|nr:hypothetical protein TNCV_568751 [Trichonephila clavipes]
MDAVDFLHHENPPTWAEVEPATLGAEDQHQTNPATQSAKDYIVWENGDADTHSEVSGDNERDESFSEHDTDG